MPQKNILITGASGFIGSFLVDHALAHNYRVIAGVRAGSSRKYLNNKDIRIVEFDFSSDAALNRVLLLLQNTFGAIDFIIHNAGVTRAISNEVYEEVNFENTTRFVKALQDNRLVPKKFVFVSSLTAFGPGKSDRPINELQVQEPLTAYGRSKQKAEQMLYATKEFPFVVINPTTVYGPRDKDVLVLLKSIARHFEFYIGNSHQELSFVHVQDLCNAIFLAMESPASRQNFLVSDGDCYSARVFNQMVKKALNKKTLSIVFPVNVVRAVAYLTETYGRSTGRAPILNRERLKEFEAMNWKVDCTPINNLGYMPVYKLEQGLQHTIQWYREQGWI